MVNTRWQCDRKERECVPSYRIATANRTPSRARRIPSRAGSAVRAMFSVILTCMLVLSLSGCKDTDVLTEKIVDQSSTEIDYSLEPLRNETANAALDEGSFEVESETDHADEQEKRDPTYDEDDPTSDSQTDQQQHADDVSYDYAATDGGKVSEGAGGASNDGSGGSGAAGGGDDDTEGGSTVKVEKAPAPDDDNNNGDDVDEPEKPNGGNQGGDPTGGQGGGGETYDDGTYTKLPTGTKKIAAAGQYALIVQMLGGKGALSAADGTWLSETRNSGAFPNEGLESVSTAWSGDGTNAGTADVNAIIAAGTDTVLTSASYGALTDDQKRVLNEAGVNVVVMPVVGVADALDADIVQAVRVVGELLKDAGTSIQYDAQAMASKYVSQHDDALNKCLTANGGYTTRLEGGSNWAYIYQGIGGQATAYFSDTRYVMAYVDGWATAKVSTIHETRSVNGEFLYPETSIGSNGFDMDCSEGMGLYIPKSDITSSNFALIDYYLQSAGVMDIETSHQGTIATATNHYPNYFNVPYISRWINYNCLWFSFGNYQSRDYVTVGDNNYPAIVTRTTEYAERIVSSANKVRGVYNIGQPYEVWVMPSGLSGSWTDGTVESFLVAPWAYCMYQQNKNLESCNGFVNDFYSTFYRCGAGDLVQNYGTTYQATCPTS